MDSSNSPPPRKIPKQIQKPTAGQRKTTPDKKRKTVSGLGFMPTEIPSDLVRRKKPVPDSIDPLDIAKKSLKDKARNKARLLHNADIAKRRHKHDLNAMKTADKIMNGGSGLVTPEIMDALPVNAREYVEQENVIFRPTPRQIEFLAATEQEVFYGGARGGGKSYALLVDPLRYCDKRNHRALIIRKTMPELRDMIAKSHHLYPKAYPGAKWREQEKEWRFPSGARIEFGYCDGPGDAMRYIGQSYSAVCIDELPHYPTSEVYDMLRSSLRSVDPEVPALLRATGNPGAIGSLWVKEMFIDPAPANTRFSIPIQIKMPDGRVIDEKITRKYIPATVFDNPYLTHDANYITMLASLPEMKRKQWLEGDWTAFDAAAFSDFRLDTHVIEPFELPSSWIRFRAADWGYSSPAACLWFAIDNDNRLFVYRELYTKGKTADEFARMVLDLEAGETIRYGVLDVSTWSNRGDNGPSIAEAMIQEGCRWRQSDRSSGSRRMGKMELHKRLRVNPQTEEPSLFIFNTCRNLVRTLPVLPLDDNNSEDIDTTSEDHCFTGDTLVDTANGPVAISELVGTEGQVYSFDGKLEDYYNVRLTRKATKIVKVLLSNGVEVRCTPDHRFWVNNSEWVEAKDLTNALVRVIEDECTTQSSSQNPDKSSTDFSIMPSSGVDIIKGQGNFAFIEKCGSTTKGKSQTSGISTTLIKTKPTMPLKTSSACLHNNTQALNTLTTSLPLDTYTGLQQWQQRQSGTEAKLDVSGIDCTTKTTKKPSTKSEISSVLTAQRNLSLFPAETNDIAADTAKQHSVESQASITSLKAVSFVSLSLVSTSTAKPIHAPKAVAPLSVTDAGLADVYCLTVPTTSAFSIEGGIIVSNCYDALRYGIMSRPISIETPYDRSNPNRRHSFTPADRVFGY